MKIGAMQGVLGGQEPLLETANAMGFEGVELYFGDATDKTTVPERRRETKAEAAAAGIEIPSLCIGSLNRGGFSSDDEETRRRALELVRASLDAAEELGAKVILVPFFFAAAPHSDQEIQRVVDHFREVAPEAESRGLTLGYEGELPADAVRDLLTRIDSPAVRCYYDIGNAVWLGHDPLQELRQLQDVICQVHVKEFTEKLNDKPLGEGNVPIPEAAEALREIGYDGWVFLETGTFNDPQTFTPQQLAYVRQFL